MGDYRKEIFFSDTFWLCLAFCKIMGGEEGTQLYLLLGTHIECEGKAYLYDRL